MAIYSWKNKNKETEQNRQSETEPVHQNPELCSSQILKDDNNSLYGSPGGSVVKNLPANAEEPGSISGSGRSPREGNSNPL